MENLEVYKVIFWDDIKRHIDMNSNKTKKQQAQNSIV